VSAGSGEDDVGKGDEEEQGRIAMEEMRHSRVGIAAFVVALIVWTCLFASYCIQQLTYRAPVWDNTKSGGGYQSPYVFLLIVVAVLLSPFGLGLGIADLCEKNRRRLLTVIGAALNALILLSVLAFVCFVFYRNWRL
jgi:low temperature requirement protein LtrA